MRLWVINLKKNNNNNKKLQEQYVTRLKLQNTTKIKKGTYQLS